MPELGVIQRTVAETPWEPDRVGDYLELLAALGYDGLELSVGGLAGLDRAAVEAALDRTGLTVPTAYVGTEAVDGRVELADAGDGLEGDVGRTAAAYRALGCERFVLGSPVDVETPADIDRSVAAIEAFADRLADHGVTLHYHNHAYEFDAVDGETFFDALVEDSGVVFELDVGHVALAGRDPVAVLERLDGRLGAVHVTDVDADGTVVELGDGVIDLAACAAAAVEGGAEWLVYEYLQTPDNEASLRHAADFMESL